MRGIACCFGPFPKGKAGPSHLCLFQQLNYYFEIEFDIYSFYSNKRKIKFLKGSVLNFELADA